MMRVAVAATLAVLPGCFTTWVTLQATGQPGAFREDGREERVPLPGVAETLVVSLPLTAVNPSDYHFHCEANQVARDAVYASSTRYGRQWKVMTAIMFVTEAALGATLLLTAGRDEPGALAAGGYFSLDALGTAVLLFAPRKDSYDRTEAAVTTQVRSVCPEGVVLEIAGDSFPMNAAGTLGDLGDAALDAWMREPSGPSGQLVVTFGGRSIPLQVGDVERCVWNRQRDGSPRDTRGSYCPGLPQFVAAVFELPAGTLAQVP